MGQTQSNAKLSSEVTLNRIREACQYDPSVPQEIRNFKIEALVNDLNVFGMDIPVVDSNGKRRGAMDICQDVRQRALPNVEDICMANPQMKGEMSKVLDHLVRHFNTYYGARISMYNNPLDPSQGRRSYRDVCDDLYLVSDRVHRRLNDQPALIKNKLLTQINQLQQRKALLDSTFNSSLLNISQLSQNSDAKAKLQEKITAARNMYLVTNSLLNDDLNVAKEAFMTVVKQMNSNVNSSLEQIRAQLQNYRQQRGDSFANQLNSLLGIVSSLPQGLYTCQHCLDRFGMTVDELTAQRNRGFPVFSKTMHEKVSQLSKMYPTQQGLAELLKCYKQLVQDGVQCQSPGASVPRTIFQAHSTGNTGGFPLPVNNLNTPENVAQVVVGSIMGTLPPEYRLKSYNQDSTTIGTADAQEQK